MADDERLDGFDVIVRKEKTGKAVPFQVEVQEHEPSHAGFVGDGMLFTLICDSLHHLLRQFRSH